MILLIYQIYIGKLTTSKALKKLNSLLLYINKGKKGISKKRLKTSIFFELFRRKFIIFIVNS